MLAVLGELGVRAHIGRVRPDVGLCERKRREGTGRQAREVALLLFVGPEVHERTGHAYGLVRREEGAGRPTPAGHDLERLRVGGLGKAETAVLPRDLDAVGAQLGESPKYVLRYPAVAVDRVAVDVGARESLDPGEPLARAFVLSGIRLWRWPEEA